MTEAHLMQFGQDALLLYLKLAGPILLFSLTVGLIVSILQAVTQIQDMTLTFIPKIAATILAIVLFGSWMLRLVIMFTYQLIMNMPGLVR